MSASLSLEDPGAGAVSWKSRAGLLACLGFFSLFHLARPNTANHRYQARIGPLTYAFNADSAAFARLVVRFPRGFVECAQGRERILRPLYPALGWLGYRVLYPGRGLIPAGAREVAARMMTRAHHPELWRGIDPGEVILAWGALVAVNFLGYGLSLLLLYQGLVRCFNPGLAWWLALLPFSHFDVIDYLLVPQGQPFNLVLPSLFLYALLAAWKGTGSGGWLALGAGVTLLGKGLVFPFLNWIYEYRGGRRGERGRRSPLTLLLLGLPLGGYLLGLAVFRLPIYNHEVACYRQFVWMIDYWREGRAAAIPLAWGRSLVREIGGLFLGFPVWWAGLAVLLARGRPPFLRDWTEWRWRHLAVYLISGLVFWTLANYHQLRLSITYYPPLLMVLGSIADRKGRNARYWIMGIVFLTLLGQGLGYFSY